MKQIPIMILFFIISGTIAIQPCDFFAIKKDSHDNSGVVIIYNNGVKQTLYGNQLPEGPIFFAPTSKKTTPIVGNEKRDIELGYETDTET